MNLLPSLSQEPELSPEPSYVREYVRQGKCAIVYFGGQTTLYIPNAIVKVLGGIDELHELAQERFGTDVEETYLIHSFQYDNSYMMNLPPALGRDDHGNFVDIIDPENNDTITFIEGLQEESGITIKYEIYSQ